MPGSVKDSLLIKAIHHTDKNLQMPKEKLSNEIIGDFEKWVALGAADPRDNSAKIAKQELDIEKGRQFWAFQPVKMPAAPKVKDSAWPRSDLDRHLLATLEARGLKPVADADCYTLIRRVYFDLIGLPPPPEEVQRFAKEYAAQPGPALERVVDQLLGFAPVRGAGADTGWMLLATPNRRDDRSTSISRTPGAIAITSSPRSTPISHTISSSKSNLPAICYRPAMNGRKPIIRSPPGFSPSAPSRSTNGYRFSFRWTSSMNRSTLHSRLFRG